MDTGGSGPSSVPSPASVSLHTGSPANAEPVAYQESEYWCSIAYYELNSRVGEVYHAQVWPILLNKWRMKRVPTLIQFWTNKVPDFNIIFTKLTEIWHCQQRDLATQQSCTDYFCPGLRSDHYLLVFLIMKTYTTYQSGEFPYFDLNWSQIGILKAKYEFYIIFLNTTTNIL